VTDDGRSLRIAEDAAGSRLWPTEAEAARVETQTERAATEAARAKAETERLLRERAEARVRQLEAELAKRGG
jgi:hypothetical protein